MTDAQIKELYQQYRCGDEETREVSTGDALAAVHCKLRALDLDPDKLLHFLLTTALNLDSDEEVLDYLLNALNNACEGLDMAVTPDLS